jgi:hypothetical protein
MTTRNIIPKKKIGFKAGKGSGPPYDYSIVPYDIMGDTISME